MFQQVESLSLLVSLKLRKNQLTSVPPEVFSLEALSLLDLTGNVIAELPEALSTAVALKSLLLSGQEAGQGSMLHCHTGCVVPALLSCWGGNLRMMEVLAQLCVAINILWTCHSCVSGEGLL